jgi:hypothetical protein
MMIKLKIFFVVLLLSLIFILGTFVPGKTTDRFLLPDGCGNYCSDGMECDWSEDLNCPKYNEKIVFLGNKCRGQVAAPLIPGRKK